MGSFSALIIKAYDKPMRGIERTSCPAVLQRPVHRRFLLRGVQSLVVIYRFRATLSNGYSPMCQAGCPAIVMVLRSVFHDPKTEVIVPPIREVRGTREGSQGIGVIVPGAAASYPFGIGSGAGVNRVCDIVG